MSECEDDLVSNGSRHGQSRHIEIEEPDAIRPTILTNCTCDRCEIEKQQKTKKNAKEDNSFMIG